MRSPFFRNSILFFFISIVLTLPVSAQEERSYEFIPAPDLWYNDVDGIRAGVRIQGQVPGTFEDGPHRLDAGIWLGTWMPDLPVSYYVSFTEPIPSISGFNSEGNIQLISSIRTGFSRHAVLFNKRWQKGFEETNYTELSIGFTGQKRFDQEYAQFEVMWQEEWLFLGTGKILFQNSNALGRHYFKTSLHTNLIGPASSFINIDSEFQQLAELGSGFKIRGRLFVGATSDNTSPEFLFSRSHRQAAEWMRSGLTRAKGTIPTPWMNSGLFQIAGDANLRGYADQDIEAFEMGAPALFSSMGSMNLELDYPNPIDRAIKKIPVIGGLMELRSYLFYDTGTSLGISGIEAEETLSDAGVGFTFSINIPDYLGKPRGIMIRYDVPLWLSHPADADNFSYRSLIGVGAIFSL